VIDTTIDYGCDLYDAEYSAVTDLGRGSQGGEDIGSYEEDGWLVADDGHQDI
jgi:hypothetical protein